MTLTRSELYMLKVSLEIQWLQRADRGEGDGVPWNACGVTAFFLDHESCFNDQVYIKPVGVE